MAPSVALAGGVGQGTVIRVAIVADIRLYREGLARVLERQPNVGVVATAATGDGSLAPLAQLAPDLVLIDMAMADSLAAIQRVTVIAPGAKVVSLSVRDGEDDRDVLASAEAGAIAYVPREASLEDLVAVIECAVRGEAVCSPRVAGALLRRIAPLADLGQQVQQVLDLSVDCRIETRPVVVGGQPIVDAVPREARVPASLNSEVVVGIVRTEPHWKRSLPMVVRPGVVPRGGGVM